jgi:hypothetical protein
MEPLGFPKQLSKAKLAVSAEAVYVQKLTTLETAIQERNEKIRNYTSSVPIIGFIGKPLPPSARPSTAQSTGMDDLSTDSDPASTIRIGGSGEIV